MGRYESLVSQKSFLWYAPQLSGASILCFPILSLLRVHCWGWVWLWDWERGSQKSICLLPEFPQGSPSGIDTWLDGCNILYLPIWQATFFFQWYQRNYHLLSFEQMLFTGHLHEQNRLVLVLYQFVCSWVQETEYLPKSCLNRGAYSLSGSIPGSGRSPGGGHSNPFQYSYLEDPKNRGAWRLRFIGLQRVECDWSNLARPHAYLIRHHGLLYTSWTMSFELCPGVILFWISFWTPGLHFP